MPLLLSLLGIGRAWISAAFGWAVRNPAWALCVALLLANWFTLQRAEHWKARDARDAALVVRMQAASDANAKAQLAQKAAYEAKYKEQADDADRHNNALAADYDHRLAAYLRNHRLRPDQGSVGTPGSAAQDHGTQGSDRPGGFAELVTVTPADLEICTVNTRRLQVVRDWALGL